MKNSSFNVFFCFCLSMPSSALISWSSTQVLVDHWGTFCAGGYPDVHFSFFLTGDCGGVWTPDLLITRRTFYHQTTLVSGSYLWVYMKRWGYKFVGSNTRGCPLS